MFFYKHVLLFLFHINYCYPASKKKDNTKHGLNDVGTNVARTTTLFKVHNNKLPIVIGIVFMHVLYHRTVRERVT